MRTRLLAATLTISLAALGACSSDDSADAEPTPSSTGPALRQRDDGGQFTLCVPVGRKDGDFAWTGMRIHADADATLTAAGPRSSGADQVVGAWVVEAEGSSGNLALWRSSTYRHGLAWANRMPIEGASLEAGNNYRLVLRIRPDLGALPNEVSGFQVAYRAADGDEQALRNDTVLQFTKHC